MALENTLTSLIPIIRGFIKDQENKDGRNSHKFIGDPIFTLEDDFVSASSITVFINNVELLPSYFTYNVDNNQVEIDLVASGQELLDGDIILITYSYFKTWSDEQIKGYINSSLAYFVQHRYKKTFEVCDEEINSINDEEPTPNELYFISIIASILIDPQNINIDTPEFKLSRNREDSDQKQIERAFIQFTRVLGTITFNNTEKDFNDNR